MPGWALRPRSIHGLSRLRRLGEPVVRAIRDADDLASKVEMLMADPKGLRRMRREVRAEFEDYQVSTPKLTRTPAATPMAAAISAGNGAPAPIAGLPGLS